MIVGSPLPSNFVSVLSPCPRENIGADLTAPATQGYARSALLLKNPTCVDRVGRGIGPRTLSQSPAPLWAKAAPYSRLLRTQRAVAGRGPSLLPAGGWGLHPRPGCCCWQAISLEVLFKSVHWNVLKDLSILPETHLSPLCGQLVPLFPLSFISLYEVYTQLGILQIQALNVQLWLSPFFSQRFSVHKCKRGESNNRVINVSWWCN